jgi:hypothetical protein
MTTLLQEYVVMEKIPIVDKNPMIGRRYYDFVCDADGKVYHTTSEGVAISHLSSGIIPIVYYYATVRGGKIVSLTPAQ